MNSDQLRYFQVAYRTHNFAAAARAIPMSAQGFTKSIRALEAELGVALFMRDPDTGENIPTDYAHVFIDYVNDQQIHFRNVERNWRIIDAEMEQRVYLAAALGIMGLLGDDFVQTLAKEHPDLKLSYIEANDTMVEELLSREEYGVAFTLASFNPEFETQALYSTPTCLWIHEDDPLANKETISWKDLDDRAIALPGEEFKCYDALMNKCREVDSHPHIALTSSEMFWLYNFVYEGHGIAFSAKHLGELPFFRNDGVKCIPLEDAQWTFGISTLPRHKLNPSEKAFRRFCIKYCEKRFGKVELQQACAGNDLGQRQLP